MSHDRRLHRAERQITPTPTPALDAEIDAALSEITNTWSRADVDRQFPEPDPSACDLDADIARVIRREWAKHNDA